MRVLVLDVGSGSPFVRGIAPDSPAWNLVLGERSRSPATEHSRCVDRARSNVLRAADRPACHPGNVSLVTIAGGTVMPRAARTDVRAATVSEQSEDEREHLPSAAAPRWGAASGAERAYRADPLR